MRYLIYSGFFSTKPLGNKGLIEFGVGGGGDDFVAHKCLFNEFLKNFCNLLSMICYEAIPPQMLLSNPPRGGYDPDFRGDSFLAHNRNL